MKWIFFIAVFFSFVSCGNDEDENKTNSEFFPVLSYLQSQVAHIDTSVYKIIQVTKTGSRVDTVYLKREDFRKAAADFLTIPDITTNKLSRKYKETRLYDEDIEKVIISYASKDEDMDVLREDIIILPSLGNENEVESIYIERFQESENGNVQKKMLWEVNKRFQVTSIFQEENKAERIETVEVSWTDTR